MSHTANAPVHVMRIIQRSARVVAGIIATLLGGAYIHMGQVQNGWMLPPGLALVSLFMRHPRKLAASV